MLPLVEKKPNLKSLIVVHLQRALFELEPGQLQDGRKDPKTSITQILSVAVDNSNTTSIQFKPENTSNQRYRNFIHSVFSCLWSPNKDDPNTFVLRAPSDIQFLQTLPYDFFKELSDEVSKINQKINQSYSIDNYKSEVINVLKQKYPWRPRMFGHHHHERRVGLCQAIQKAKSVLEIIILLRNQEEKLTPNACPIPVQPGLLSLRWVKTLRNPPTEFSRSGFHDAVYAARRIFSSIEDKAVCEMTPVVNNGVTLK